MKPPSTLACALAIFAAIPVYASDFDGPIFVIYRLLYYSVPLLLFYIPFYILAKSKPKIGLAVGILSLAVHLCLLNPMIFGSSLGFPWPVLKLSCGATLVCTLIAAEHYRRYRDE